MTDLRPFRALRYDTRRVELDRVLAPPYDVVTADERADLYASDPHHAIRLELTRDAAREATTDYREVADNLTAWRREGVLVRDRAPALYAYRQVFRSPDGALLSRDGFFAELSLEDYGTRVVRPHERTLAGPKADRLKLLRAVRANLSSVFLLYEDRHRELEPILASAIDDSPIAMAHDAAGVEHRLAALTDPGAIGRIQRFLEKRHVVIADGHHRYETALAYRDECRDECRGEAAGGGEAPWESTLVYLANAYAPGNLLLPIHRVIHKAAVPTETAWRERLPGWEQKKLPLRESGSIAAFLAE